MKHFLKHLLLALCLSFSLPQTLPGQPRYTVIDLGTLGGVNSEAFGINDAGQVTGSSEKAPVPVVHAFIWQNGVMTDLGTFVTLSQGRAINGLGHVAGHSINSNNTNQAVLWHDSVMVGLGPANIPSFAYGINDLDQVVGYRIPTVSSQQQATMWNGGAVTDLGTLGGPRSIAYGINNAGVVVGEALTSGNLQRAFRWENGTMTDLGIPGGTSGSASAVGINNAGQIVGSAPTPSGQQHAFLWSNGVMTDLGTLGGPGSSAIAINDVGQVIGLSLTATSLGYFLWQNGVMTNLMSLIDTSAHWVISAVRAINNRGEIVGQGRRNNGPLHAILLRPAAITRPRAGELWIAGEQDTIRWIGGAANQLLNIEFSVDSGTTYTLVDFAIPADSGYYVWTVPDSLSTRARIRLIDLSTSVVLAKSDTFRVKGYVLTRINTAGQYEAFTPTKDGWRYQNDTTLLWPASWWNQFVYAGIDPITGLPYPNYFWGPPTSAQPSDFTDWPMVVQTFDTSQTYWTQYNIIKSSALLRWRNWKGPFNGSCYGFSPASLQAFGHKNRFLALYPGIPAFQHLYDVFINTTIRNLINSYFTQQIGDVGRATRKAGLAKTPRTTLQEIKNMLVREDPDSARSLTFFDANGGGGHNVAPYKLQRNPTDPTQFFIYVYDSNNPGLNTPYILIDSLLDFWDEQTGLGYATSGKWLYLEYPAVDFFNQQTLGRPSTMMDGASGGEQEIVVSTSRGHSVSIHNQAGDSCGYRNGHSYTTIKNGQPNHPISGQPSSPFEYSLPDAAYDISVETTDDPQIVLSVNHDSTWFVYHRNDAASGQHDQFSVARNLLVSTTDPQTKTGGFQVLFDGATQERLFILDSLSLHQNDSLIIERVQNEALRVRNFASSKSYGLRIQYVRPGGVVRFAHSNILLGENTSHRISPNWSNFSQPIRIYIDIGNNGTIDDTIFVNNTVDVDDRGTIEIPKEYNLAQNYPNPFNPTTTIRYNLPSTGRVSLKVFDILGREVRTLVDEIQEGGYKSIQFDATGLTSGVYFYRLTAGNFSATRKLLLVR